MAISVAEEIILSVGYAIISIANIVGNSFVCAIVFKNKKLHNFTSILIANMTISDLILGVSVMIHIVLEILFLTSGSDKNSVMCGRLNVVTLFSASVSIYTMCFLAFDIHCQTNAEADDTNKRKTEIHFPGHLDCIAGIPCNKFVFHRAARI